MAWEYLDAGAGDELTLARNVLDFDRIELWPRLLRDVSELETRVPLFGQTLPHPILLAPVGYHKLFSPEGELASARGAALSGSTLSVSTMTSVAIETIAREVPDARLWFQLYVQRDRGFTQHLIERAQDAGAQALIVTIDTPVLGNRIRETEAGFTLPDHVRREMLQELPKDLLVRGHGTDLEGIYYPLISPKLEWKDIEWMKSVARVPVILKGILHPDDVELAIQAGADGIFVSNHGARNLDTAPSTISALPGIVEKTKGRVPILLDGGIRRGTDIFKALALGATAVMIGRPFVWALAAHGAQGVKDCVDLLLHDLKVTMALCGQTSVATLERSVLRRPEK
ncbi:MAG: alpha-hydroxy-acid oxidizing protein [Calditrichaeota bacterium]|nr:alpha-hydroxy-acid oxidizing protein [Calditrichota bacterium]MCB9367221.1 alpha-hydroxy-acid oxidizing protein [Calditrichota bacterium]MCB9391791.1 alpha-hydroxy-acid oxidizing protein [Calditrichota bacterium]